MLYSYMEDWRWRMDVLSALGNEDPDRLHSSLMSAKRPELVAPTVAPPGSAYADRRASILAAGGEVG